MFRRRTRCCSKTYFVTTVICIFYFGIYITDIKLLQNYESYSSIQMSAHEGHAQCGKGDELTLVTAYFNIGSFHKTSKIIFSASTYYNWMTNFQFVNNCVILYTDELALSVQFKSYRRHLPPQRTKVYVLNQESLWSFRMQPRINEIYHQKGYPIPGIPAYSSAMHAKYELVEKVIKENISTTTYLAWIDIGYFRNTIADSFEMKAPTSMKDGHISFSQVGLFNPNLTLKEIIYQQKLFVGGGLFIGKPAYLYLFIRDYKIAVEHLLKMKLMNSDQQIVYAMYSSNFFFLPKIPIQTFYDETRLRNRCSDRWFYLGELCQLSVKQNSTEKKCIPN